MKVSKKILDGVWVRFDEDVEFLVRPFPASKHAFRIQNDDSRIGEYLYLVFKECVLDWKGFVDDNDQILECNDDNKQLVFDLIDGVGLFVFEEQQKLQIKKADELKNS